MDISLPNLFTINKYSHCFTVTEAFGEGRSIVYKFCLGLVHQNQISAGKNAQPPKIYAMKVLGGLEFRFHIGHYNMFIEYLFKRHIYPDRYKVYENEVKPGVVCKFELDVPFKLNEKQERAIAFCTEDDKSNLDAHSRLITSPTGSGKSVMGLAIAAKRQKRTMVLVLPKYTEKWASDISSNTTVKPKEIMGCQGGDQLRGLIQLAKDNELSSKFVVMSLITLKNFFDAYELKGKEVEEEYGCTPDKLCEVLGLGTIIIDEIHEHLFAVFRFMTYANVEKIIGLSGTFISLDQFISQIQKAIFPREIRFDEIKMEKYIKVKAVGYSFNDFKKAKIKTSSYGSSLYSHNEFEKSILKDPKLTDNYCKLLKDCLDRDFFDHYKEGDRFMVYASSIKMCDTMTKKLKSFYPNIDIRRYVENDPYKNVIEPVGRVSTIQSAGTAIDIPGLTNVCMTTNVKSPVANRQALGRLRKNSQRDTRFTYTYSYDIPTQVKYHQAKRELFEPLVASQQDITSPISV
jgi:superfamily II DNA or RNA helicase